MKEIKGNIIPSMRYKNAPEAIKWLCEAFGFKENLIVPGEKNTIEHAQLTYGNAMIMLGSVKDNEFDKYLKTPQELDGINTQTPYIIVPEIDKHYENALLHGAKIILEIKDEDYGGRGYTCCDPEGYLWSFGSYDPWEEV